jgi:hypothetical protein
MPIGIYPLIDPEVFVSSNKFRNVKKAKRKIQTINHNHNCQYKPVPFQKNRKSGEKTRIDPPVFLL